MPRLKLVSAKELAEILSVSVRHVWRMKGAGKLPAFVRMGKAIRWRLDDIERFIAWGCPSRKEYEAKLKVQGVKQ